MKTYVLRLSASSSGGRMSAVLDNALSRADDLDGIEYITEAKSFISFSERGLLRGSRVIFAVETDESGISIDACRILRYLRLSCLTPDESRGRPLDGAVGGVIIDGRSDLFTKDLGRRLVFTSNQAGCIFPGKPLVEATADLKNFRVRSGVWDTDLEGAYALSVIELVEKVRGFSMPVQEKPAVLTVHAGNVKTSNSLALWDMTASRLEGLAETEIISIRNGQLWDCRGCKYDECLHFGEKGDCFYGGVIVEKVYPAMLKSDVLVLVCPNYNDSVSANMMAFINRLTSLFRAHDFSRKRVYAVIVSGYSGGDIVAQQIIGALNMNKKLILPAQFALMATANNPGEAVSLPGIEESIGKFARRIISPV